jgi:acyl-CoA reductase-like NAD-dependent aldehyde dehydrogenase
MKVYAPFTQKVIGEVSTLHSKEEAEALIQLAKQAETPMRELSGGDRKKALLYIADKLQMRKEAFIKTIIEESAKPRKYAEGEVNRAIETFQIAAEESVRLPHELIDLDRSEKGRGVQGEVRYVPVGLTLGISPFNFPLNLAAHKIAPAIAAGCPIILKPSSKTPLTMELLKEVIADAPLPKDAFSVMHCKRELGDYFVEHDAIKLLSFTGSPEVGWSMKRSAGKKRVVLELGGNAAAIISENFAITSQLINDCIAGGFAYSGQVCIHTQRIYVHKRNFEAFKKQFIAAIKLLEVEDPRLPSCKYSSMIDESNVERINQWVKEAISAGAELLCGGESLPNIAYAFTVLTKVPQGQAVLEEEVFGPVVVLESYTDLDEVITAVNSSKWGLQASIYTESINELNTAMQKLDVGGVLHNLPTIFRVDEMPYGGIKDSGFGREGIKYAMRDYLEPKLLVRKIN